MDVFCGIDWAEDAPRRRPGRPGPASSGQAAHHRRCRRLQAPAGSARRYGDTAERPDPGRDRDLPRPAGRVPADRQAPRVYAINPMAAARYRDRHSVWRKKSDPGDALVLANILRTDMHAHRPLPDDSDLARAVAVLARAQQDATWNRQQIANQLRSLLREYFPGPLAAFADAGNGLCRPEARSSWPPPPRRPGREAYPHASSSPAAQAGRSAASKPRPTGSARSSAPQWAPAPAGRGRVR